MHVRTRAQRALARYRSVPAQTLEARATAIVVGRETRREMRRDLARLEAEESFGGVGYARVDPDALAAKLARWEHDRVEREFRLERARDAQAAEETNGGFRPTLSSTPRAVALRDRVASADRRPCARVLATRRRARGREDSVATPNDSNGARGREDSVATSNDSNGGGTRRGGSRDARGGCDARRA